MVLILMITVYSYMTNGTKNKKKKMNKATLSDHTDLAVMLTDYDILKH